MSLQHKRLIIGVLLFCVFILSLYGLNEVKNKYRVELLSSPIVHRMIPTYRSLRKLPDIIFIPWSAFTKSSLETYEISISPQNIERMNEALPNVPFNSVLLDESKLWVSAHFRTQGYEANVKIRYRGNLPSHWNAYQKSYSIKFDKDNLFQGKRKLTLIIPSDRRYIDMQLNSYRAEKLGLIHPDEFLVNVEVNGADKGVLLAFESWSQPWIEKMPISALSEIYGLDEYENGMTYQDRWSSWNAEEPIDFDPLKTLEEIIVHAPDDVFKRLIPQLIDIEDWYAWDVMKILAAGYHEDTDTTFGANNLVLIFDRAEGLFKPVPYNTIIYTPSNRLLTGQPGIAGAPPYLFQRILSIPAFRERRDEVFAEYVKNEKADDLLFVENWKKTYNREFLLDNAKNDNHFMYLSKIDESAQSIKEHFDDPFGILQVTYDPPVEKSEALNLPESFKYLEAAGANPQVAATQHPSLIFNKNTITIPAGIHTFRETIIIPAHTELKVLPGATLRMGEGVSLVSYSPVTAIGTPYRPITVKPLISDKPWGVFAVLNTPSSTSSFQYMNLHSGGDDTINGVTISGTLSLHNARSTITYVGVSNAQGDDGINVKGSYTEITHTTLTGNISDGLDLDYIDPDSIIKNNIFIDNKGDALDLSWSTIHITDNTITTCVDKGISVGEKSNVTIVGNTISNCAIGIAIKDSSQALITGNTLQNNATAFSLYQKKPYFMGGHATATANTLLNNDNITYIDAISTLFLDKNTTSAE
ncbi:MAG: parallel beta-helix repeat protein [Acidimicrobiales bacterium]|jgi:parallel beta-helix repeat protein